MLHYIDPGTGSMLFAILIGIIGALNYAARTAWVKIRFILSGGKAEANDEVIPIAIFSDDKRYWNVFEPVCAELGRRGMPVTYLTASEDDPAFKSDIPGLTPVFTGEGNKTFAKMNLLKATIVFSTTPGLGVYQWKRSKDVKCYVHILHAAGGVVLYRMFGLNHYDAVMTSGQFQIDDLRAFEALHGLPEKEVPMVGIPYMDVMADRAANAPALEKDRRTVLLAPSWGPSAIFARFGSDILTALLKTGYKVIVRPHPQSFKSEAEMIEKIMAQFPDSEDVEWNRDVDNFECLRRADIMISDFSGVILDYALIHDKPVIYTDTEFDKSVYDAWWLDREIWNFTVFPRIGMKLTADRLGSIKDMIDECIEDERFAKGRDEVRDEVWQCRGEGAVRAADYLIAKYEELTSTKEGEK